MNPFIALDNWLLYKIEKFCHWFQRCTGKTNYFWAQIAMLFLAGIIISWIIDDWSGGWWTEYPFLALFGFLLDCFFLLVFLLFSFWAIPREEKRAFVRISKGIANPHKAEFKAFFFRIVFLVFLVFFGWLNAISWFLGEGMRIDNVVIFFCFWLFNYFYACDPLPPCRGKVWDAVSTWFAKPATVKLKA